MSTDPKQRVPGKPMANGRSKVKSGCRTCKVRKVKCDEGRPACQRCVSTGRKCDGYGIWGGGGSAHTHHTDGRLALKHNPFPLFVNAPGDDEHCSFEWFRQRTSKKLPGPFESVFWESLVLRASYSEPAVLHAVLALGLAHKKDSIEGACDGPAHEAPDEEERFILRHYSKSIRQLQPHFKTKDKESVRIALIACMLFVCLEFIRGRYQTGNEHLINGMRLICDLGGYSEIGSSKQIDLRSLEPQDIWLMETFAKLNLQANFLGQGDRSLVRIIQDVESVSFPVIFTDMPQARRRLDWLQYEVGQLASEWERRDKSVATPIPSLLEKQRDLIEALSTWEKVYLVSRAKLIGSLGHIGPCAYLVLKLYHKMALIMAHTCFTEQGETTYDYHTDKFISLITNAIDLYSKVQEFQSVGPEDSPFSHRPGLSLFTSDKGWIPPLYFTATRCRVHRLRLQAIRLLNVTPSKEGVWDAQLASAVAREVIRLEEHDTYGNGQFDDDFDWNDKPTADQITVAGVPEFKRMADVQVTLPNGPREPLAITCRPSMQGADVVARVYDPVTKTWH